MKQFWTAIQGPSDGSLEVVFYRKIMVFTLALSVVNLIANTVIGLKMVTNVKWIVLVIIALATLKWVKAERHLVLSQVINYGFIIFYFIPSGWQTTGGHNYLTLSYIMLVAISIGFLMKGWVRNVLLGLEFGVFVGLLYLQYTVPGSVDVVDPQTYISDLTAQVPVVFFSTVYIAITFSKAWRGERERLQQITITDTLTGLYNRRYLFERLDHLSRNDQTAMVIMVDIDDFKTINDTHGHTAGDQVIVGIGQTLSKVVGNRGFIGRYGGDEFVIVLEDARDDEATTIIVDIQKAVDCAVFAGDIQVKVSGGMSKLQPGYELDTTLATADQLLYWVKNHGKGQIVAGSLLDETVGVDEVEAGRVSS